MRLPARTRATPSSCCAYGVDRPVGGLIALHQHNEAQGAQSVIARLAAGERVAYASDAGTPAISDPGARLVAAVRAAGHRVVPLPGASSVTAALSAAGSVEGGADAAAGFVFAGFLSSKAAERDTQVRRLASEPRSVVLLEAPHRIEALARSLAALGERPVTLARELTKQFEDIAMLPCSALADWLAADAQRLRGEFVLVLHALAAASGDGSRHDDGLRVLRLLIDELPLKTAVRLAADITGASRNALYQQALQWKAGDD